MEAMEQEKPGEQRDLLNFHKGISDGGDILWGPKASTWGDCLGLCPLGDRVHVEALFPAAWSVEDSMSSACLVVPYRFGV